MIPASLSNQWLKGYCDLRNQALIERSISYRKVYCYATEGALVLISTVGIVEALVRAIFAFTPDMFSCCASPDTVEMLKEQTVYGAAISLRTALNATLLLPENLHVTAYLHEGQSLETSCPSLDQFFKSYYTTPLSKQATIKVDRSYQNSYAYQYLQTIISNHTPTDANNFKTPTSTFIANSYQMLGAVSCGVFGLIEIVVSLALDCLKSIAFLHPDFDSTLGAIKTVYIAFALTYEMTVRSGCLLSQVELEYLDT